jgi:hypothetical protein
MAASAEHGSLEVTVTFPLGQGKPFHEREAGSETTAELLNKALSHFGIQPDGSAAYYLIHGGSRVEGGLTLSEIAQVAAAVKFTLVKELIQG